MKWLNNNGNINVTNGNLQLYGKVALQGYDNWLRLNNSVNGTNSPFTYGIYCGNGVLRTDGEFQVGDGGNCFKANSSAITCNKSLIVNAGVDFGYGATIRNAGLELYFSTPFIDFHFDNSNNDYTSRIIEGGKGVLNINGVTCSSSNLAANNVSATNVNVSSRINADAATAIFNNVYVKDELRSTTWAIDNITNLGSTFYVSPCIIFTNPSIYINSKSGTTVTLTITDNNIISSNANITGTINASSLTAKQYYKIYDSNGKNERTFVSWSGSMLSFGLVSQNGSNEAEIQILPGSQTVTFNGDIGATQGTIYAGSIDATGSLSVRKTARMDILTFYDYQQDTLPTASDMIYRRPIASAASNNGRVAFLQGASGNKISIRAQYGKSDFSSATFTASSSDIRLKEDVKDSSVNALSKIMQMQIREFNWKQTGVHQELGCVADELELIDPLLTTGGGYDDDGTMNIKSIDTLLLSEYAIKGIQELYKQNKHQQKRIEYLESQLKNK